MLCELRSGRQQAITPGPIEIDHPALLDAPAPHVRAHPTGFSEAYVETWGAQWRTFLTRERTAAAPQQLATVVADLERFLLPLIEEAQGAGIGNRAGDGFPGAVSTARQAPISRSPLRPQGRRHSRRAIASFMGWAVQGRSFRV